MWFPMILWVGGLVCAILQAYLQVMRLHNPDVGPYQWASVNMSVGSGIVLTPFWGSSIVLNGYCTSKPINEIKGVACSGLTCSLIRSFDLEDLESIRERRKRHGLETAPIYCPRPHGIWYSVLGHQHCTFHRLVRPQQFRHSYTRNDGKPSLKCHFQRSMLNGQLWCRD
jgi:hypothetical protein